MNIAIVDDNKTEQDKLGSCVLRWARSSGAGVQITAYDSGEAFLSAEQNGNYDIVFMDIIMDGMNGIETARILRSVSIDTLLIFITTSPEFMAQAFPCHAFDYVMKPYTPERITEVLDEAKRALGKLSEVIEIVGCRLLLSDILYLYTDSTSSEIHTKQTLQRLRISFTELSERLSPYPTFTVVGRGVIVNFDNVSHISDTDCVMVNGDRVLVSRRRIKETEQAFYDRQFKIMLSKG